MKLIKTTIILLLTFPLVALQAQTQDDLRLLNACKEEVRAINNQTLYRKHYTEAWNDSSARTITDFLTLYNAADAAFLVYYDTEKRIRKFIDMFTVPEQYGYSIHYFDTGGYVVKSIFFGNGAMNPLITGTRYMSKGKLVYLDINTQDEAGEVAKAIEQYGGKMPDADFYSDRRRYLLHTDSLKNHYYYEHFKLDIATNPKVVFRLPQTNDKTTINVRRANLRIAPATDAEIITAVELGNIVEILEITNNQWYKVKVNEKIGYIFGELLEVVEQKI